MNASSSPWSSMESKTTKPLGTSFTISTAREPIRYFWSDYELRSSFYIGKLGAEVVEKWLEVFLENVSVEHVANKLWNFIFLVRNIPVLVQYGTLVLDKHANKFYHVIRRFIKENNKIESDLFVYE